MRPWRAVRKTSRDLGRRVVQLDESMERVEVVRDLLVGERRRIDHRPTERNRRTRARFVHSPHVHLEHDLMPVPDRRLAGWEPEVGRDPRSPSGRAGISTPFVAASRSEITMTGAGTGVGATAILPFSPLGASCPDGYVLGRATTTTTSDTP